MTDEFANVQRVLQRLPAVLQHKVVKNAARASGRVIATKAKSLAPVRSGLLKRSIGIALAKKSKQPKNKVRLYVLPRTKVSVTAKAVVNGQSAKLKAKLTAFYGHFVEFGTKNTRKRPYLYPAAQATQSIVVKKFQESVYKGVEREVKRMAQ